MIDLYCTKIKTLAKRTLSKLCRLNTKSRWSLPKVWYASPYVVKVWIHNTLLLNSQTALKWWNLEQPNSPMPIPMSLMSISTQVFSSKNNHLHNFNFKNSFVTCTFLTPMTVEYSMPYHLFSSHKYKNYDVTRVKNIDLTIILLSLSMVKNICYCCDVKYLVKQVLFLWHTEDSA